MKPSAIYINIICGDVIDSAVIQGGKENTIDFTAQAVSAKETAADAVKNREVKSDTGERTIVVHIVNGEVDQVTIDGQDYIDAKEK